jgi:tryptophan synthase alpha chain
VSVSVATGVQRIDRAFASARAEHRTAVAVYITVGFPERAATAGLLRAALDGGADLIELGVPFSDPIADGPVNQRAAARALAQGTSLAGVLGMVASQRSAVAVPIVLFTYFNPIHSIGVAAFAEQAAASGVDGVLCVDLPPEEAEKDYAPRLRAAGLDTIFLLAPTSTRERVRRAQRLSSGFVYYVSRTGVTGVRRALPADLLRQARELRRRIRLPLAVGFGISEPGQIASVARVADGVVVGSALVRFVEESAGDPDLPARLEAEARRLSAPLRERAGK